MKSITVSAQAEDPNPVVEFVEEQLSLYNCPPKVLYQIEVAIEEIFVNIVRYAELTDDKGIEIRCEVRPDPLCVIIQFLDQGIPFDPLAKDDPDISPEGIMDREGGLGIFMVKQMMDDVSYSYENGKNTLTIQKNLPLE